MMYSRQSRKFRDEGEEDEEKYGIVIKERRFKRFPTMTIDEILLK
jgi:hypothetical protein